jgi:hypothetical protein
VLKDCKKQARVFKTALNRSVVKMPLNPDQE